MVDKTELRNWFANNPKMMGVLWAIMLLLVETGPVLAGSGGSKCGP